MSRVQWTEPAVKDLLSFKQHYEAVSGGFAERACEAAVDAGRWLLDYPNARTRAGSEGLRKWRVVNTPLLLLYRPARNGIVILRVQHDRELWQQT